MSDKEWGVEAFVYRYPATPELAVARWHTSEGNATRLPPMQVEGLPGGYAELRYTATHAWLMDFNGGVYSAPVATGEFSWVMDIPVRMGGEFAIVSYAGGLVVNEIGTRWVYFISDAGDLLLEQELPPLASGDTASSSRPIQVRMLCLIPATNTFGLVIGAGANGYGGIAFGFTTAVDFGQPMDMLPDVYVADTQRPAAQMASVAADTYAADRVLCTPCEGDDWWVKYSLYESLAGGQCLEHQYYDSQQGGDF